MVRGVVAGEGGGAECADSGERGAVWRGERWISAPDAEHRSAVGLFPLATLHINYHHPPTPHPSPPTAKPTAINHSRH